MSPASWPRVAGAVALCSLMALPAWAQAASSGAPTAKPPLQFQPGGRTATRVMTTHLQIEAYASEAVAAPGQRLSLLLDITPRRGIHVYAPGAANYRVIELAMTPMPAVRFQPLKYPAAEIYEFVPLHERIPAYQAPFQLTQPVTLGNDARSVAQLGKMASLTIKGTLNYQACDDRLCFAPVSVPLSWTVTLK